MGKTHSGWKPKKQQVFFKEAKSIFYDEFDVQFFSINIQKKSDS